MKIGRRRKYNGNWQLYLRDVPKRLGDDLELLWQQQIEDAKEDGTKPLGWHAFLVNIFEQFTERAYAVGDLHVDG